MTKGELLENLEYCTGDTEIKVKIDGRFVSITDVQNRSQGTNEDRMMLLIPERKRG